MQCGGNARPCQTFPLQKRFALLQDCSGRKSERLVEPNIRECDGLDGCCSFSGTIGMASVVGCSATMKGALHAHIIARYDDCAGAMASSALSLRAHVTHRWRRCYPDRARDPLRGCRCP